MKKVIASSMILLFAFGLVACKDQTSSSTTTQSTESSTTTTTIDTSWNYPSDITNLSFSEQVAAYDNTFRIALFLTNNPETSMAINFELPLETCAFVQYRLLDSEIVFEQEATYKSTKVGKKILHHYETTMDNLLPDSTYEYRIRDEAWLNISESHTFKTASSSHDEFSFMVLADPQENSVLGYMAYSHVLLNAMDTFDQPIDFNLFVGDIVNDADIRMEWDAFFTYSSPFIYDTPLVATTGNHDMAGISGDRMLNLEFDGYFNLPNNGPTYDSFDDIENDDRPGTIDQGKTYSFDYQNTHFVSINSEVLCDGTTACAVSDQSAIDRLKTWLISDLTSHSQKWTIVYLHRGPYSLSYDNSVIREELTSLFDTYDVDIVVSGHDHQYSRSIYQNGTLIPFSQSDVYTLGTISLINDPQNDNNFNDYQSSLGVTYLVGNTAGTKYYGNEKSSGIDVHYAFIESNPVVPVITITEDYIKVVSYGFSKTSEIQIEVDSVYVLETFFIR